MIKKFYQDLFKEKQKESYRQTYEARRRDFLHKYLLFWLDPYQNTRHQLVANMLPSGERFLDVGCWDGEGSLKYGVHEKFKEGFLV